MRLDSHRTNPRLIVWPAVPMRTAGFLLLWAPGREIFLLLLAAVAWYNLSHHFYAEEDVDKVYIPVIWEKFLVGNDTNGINSDQLNRAYEWRMRNNVRLVRRSLAKSGRPVESFFTFNPLIVPKELGMRGADMVLYECITSSRSKEE